MIIINFIISNFSPFLYIFFVYTLFMGQDEIFKYLKNAKIQNKTLDKISYFFSKDYTASQTAIELNLSRQTINNYYKIIRILLLNKQEELLVYFKNNNLCENSFNIKYIKTNKNIKYYIECNEKIFFLDLNNESLSHIKNFIEEELQDTFNNNQKTKSAKVLFNKKTKSFLLTKFLRSVNPLEDFIDQRLKKFRGLNKENLEIQLKESQYRFNHSQNDLYTTVLSLLNLNPKTSSF